VSAREEETGVTQSVEVRPSYGLTDAEVESMLLSSFEHGAEDVRQRFLREARIEGERILHAIEAALAEDGDRLSSAEEQAAIRAAAAALRAGMASEDYLAIQALTKRVDEVSADFAERRMSASVRRILVSHRVEDVEI
jgi:molecular chaperone HscA